MFFLDTDYGKIRILDTGGNKPFIINVPDGPNVIEHQLELIKQLSKRFRVICFEYPGVGFSYPNSRFDYSFTKGSELLFQVMELLKIERTGLVFSCSNSFYAMTAAEKFPDKFTHIFLSQTPSFSSLLDWTVKSVPDVLKFPFVGQMTNEIMLKKLANTWYKYSLPKETDKTDYQKIAIDSIKKGGCFCLSGLVQGMSQDKDKILEVKNVPITMIWGKNDFTHRKTNCQSISEHAKKCEVIEFDNCGHFPEIEYTQKYVRLVNERLK